MPSTRAPTGSLPLAAFLLATVVALIATFFSRDAIQAVSFNPTSSACVDNFDTPDPDPFNPGDTGECDGDSTPGATSDLTTGFFIEAPDSNFGTVISFTPTEWGVPADADVPDGAFAAQLNSLATLGLLNAACNTQLPVRFDMLDATTDINNVLKNAIGTDSGRNPGDADDQFDIVNGLPLGVTKYPDYLTRILVDADGNPLQPRARLYGQTTVSGIDISLNFVLFEPGTNIRGMELDPALGYPSVTVLQSTGDPAAQPSPSSITDFCSPLKTVTTYFGITKDGPAGTGGGVPYRTNPSSDGTYNFVTFAASLRDADNDGIENSLDPCPYDPDTNWDPRALNNPDSDTEVDPLLGQVVGDGIPNSCDPTPDERTGINDHDGDKYMNRGDNCPLVPNGIDPATGQIIGSDNQKDSDKDGIGDACDKNPNNPDTEGTVQTVCTVASVQIGAGGEAPPGPNICNESRVGIDLNGNGVFDSLEAAPSETPTGGAPTPTPTPGGQAVTATGTPGIGPETGVGSLAPAASGIPAWASIISALGGAGLVSGLALMGAHIFRRRREP